MMLDRRYWMARLIMTIPTLLGITLVTFIMVRAIPFIPAESATIVTGEEAQLLTPSWSHDVQEELRRLYGIDHRFFKGYAIWLLRLISLNFGVSTYFHQPAAQVLLSKLPVSLTLGLFSFLIIVCICVPLGIAKAVIRNHRFDRLSDFVLCITEAVPPFVIAMLLLIFLASDRFLGYFPIGGLVSPDFGLKAWPAKVLDYGWHILLPVLAYVSGRTAFITFLVRNSVSEELQKDYVLTARAKGATPRLVAIRHAFRNALLPLITHLGRYTGFFLSGSVLIESIFSLDGVGLLGYTAVMNRDYPVLLALIVFSSIAVIIGNLISDLFMVIADPRVNYESN